MSVIFKALETKNLEERDSVIIFKDSLNLFRNTYHYYMNETLISFGIRFHY
jgi:hypothetical protein